MPCTVITSLEAVPAVPSAGCLADIAVPVNFVSILARDVLIQS
jgi:hypothetical protein